MSSTSEPDYTTRLDSLSGARWKQLLRPLDPYLASLRRRRLGRTLDVGCGIGRNLAVLPPGSVGIDHNRTSVELARQRGLDALTVEEFAQRAYPTGAFDSMLVSHVIEHLAPDEARALLRDNLPYVRAGGSVVLFCPQEKGYASDATHVTWTTADDLMQLCNDVGLSSMTARSFPLPRWAGRAFIYNEFQVRAVKA